jgi:transcriptional regulator with XRE-family HTH domain
MGQVYFMSAAALKLKTTLATALRDQMRAEDLNVSTMAKRTGTSRNAIRRLLDGKNTGVTLSSMVKAAQAANLELTITAKPMSLAALRPLAERLAKTDSPAEAARLRKQLTKGYYGSSLSPAARA